MRMLRIIFRQPTPQPIPFRLGGFADRRTAAQLGADRAIDQALADMALEREWRHRSEEREAHNWMRSTPPLSVDMPTDIR